jgi:hypothetical protein
MSQNDAVHNLSTFYVPCLFLGYDKGQNWLEAVRNHLCYDFVNDIAESDRSELFGICDPLLFRN